MAILAFAAAVLSFQDAPADACQDEARRDPSYRVVGQVPVRIYQKGYEMDVLRDGRPVVGARACFRAGLGGSPGLPEIVVSNVAEEISPGRYRAMVVFDARGRWTGRVVVREPGAEAVDVPHTVEVVGPAPT